VFSTERPNGWTKGTSGRPQSGAGSALAPPERGRPASVISATEQRPASIAWIAWPIWVS
jgi:hypothetical protein